MPRIGMLSKILMGALAVELAIYAAVIAGGRGLAWWGYPCALAGCAAFGLALRLLITVDTFRQGERHRMQRTAEQEIGTAGWGRLVLAEYVALVKLFVFLHTFEWLFNRRDAAASGNGPVILCIHGYVCNGGYWGALRRALARAGFARTYTINMDPTFGSIEKFAQQVARRVDEIRGQTGAEKVVLIGHSMGGLVSRCYVQRHGGADKVSRIITLGSPHHGTESARKGKGEDAHQMVPENKWLAALNAETPVPVPITSIYTFHDNIVYPQDSAVLPQAKVIGLPGIGHLELGFSKPVQDRVIEEVREIA